MQQLRRHPAPGQAKKRALLGAVDHSSGRLAVETSATKRRSEFIALLVTLERIYAPQPDRPARPVVLILGSLANAKRYNGPIHTSKATKAFAERPRRTVEWPPTYAPEPNGPSGNAQRYIGRCRRNLTRQHLANQTFDSADHLDQEIHRASRAMNNSRAESVWHNLRSAA